MLLSDYQIVKQTMLQSLTHYEDGVSVELLIKKVSELLPLGAVSRFTELRAYVTRARIELETSGLIESVPDTEPVEIRLPVKGREVFVEATRRGHIAIVQKLLADGVGQKTKDAALISAVINDHPEIVKVLLDAGADVHAKDALFNKDALMYVTKRTSKEIVRLLENGI